MKIKRERILGGKIPSLLIRLTLPTIPGMLGMMLFNVVDTYFIGQIGAVELAAISFTFPVVMFLGSIILGIGTAVMSLFSRAVGNGDIIEEHKLAMSALILGLLVAVIITLIGLVTGEPLFRLLGADDLLMPHILTYMNIWYIGSICVVIPMIGDHILRGLGDTVTPSIVMLTCAVLNTILDPLLIFGIGIFPELGVAGAAYATVFSRLAGMCVSISVLVFREKLISFKGLGIKTILHEWKDLLYLSIPNSAVKAIVPLGVGVFTSILAQYGHTVVAGFGVATKIESLFMALYGSLSVTAAVFVGQNLGAKKYDRIKEGIRVLYGFSLCIGLLAIITLGFGAHYIAPLFNDDPQVQRIIEMFLVIVPVGFAFVSITQISGSILNIFHKPMHAGVLSIFQIAIIGIPLAHLFSNYWQEFGVFMAITISYITVGILSVYIVKAEFNKKLVLQIV